MLSLFLVPTNTFIRMGATIYWNTVFVVSLYLALLIPTFSMAAEPQRDTSTSISVPQVAQFHDESALDQDDMCIWVNSVDSSKSLVITSDKDAGKIFVYDLNGKTMQIISNPKPGNIDVRYGFPFQDKLVDIVVANQRKGGWLRYLGVEGFKIIVYMVDHLERQLIRIDDGSIITDKPTGGTLYHNPTSDKFYFIKTSEEDDGTVEQFKLYDNGEGSVMGTKVREWILPGCEGAVADDENQVLFIAQEDVGIWKFGAEPMDSNSGQLIAKVGDNGLADDVEGLAIFKTGKHDGYLVASSQLRSVFMVYDRTLDHHFVGHFNVSKVMETDGIAITSANLGGSFKSGLFLCHTDPEPSPVVAVNWGEITKILGLLSDSTRTLDK
ncbi:MAG: phytase [candidate division Zixibacteria bacterium]|nr:phytase [candidate division Zixibacteria bacterium]